MPSKLILGVSYSEKDLNTRVVTHVDRLAENRIPTC